MLLFRIIVNIFCIFQHTIFSIYPLPIILLDFSKTTEEIKTTRTKWLELIKKLNLKFIKKTKETDDLEVQEYYINPNNIIEITHVDKVDNYARAMDFEWTLIRMTSWSKYITGLDSPFRDEMLKIYPYYFK